MVWLRRPRWWGRPWVRIALTFHQNRPKGSTTAERIYFQPPLHLRARSTPPPTSQPFSGIKEERESAQSEDLSLRERERRRGAGGVIRSQLTPPQLSRGARRDPAKEIFDTFSSRARTNPHQIAKRAASLDRATYYSRERTKTKNKKE